jgi:hypothetical protein
MHEPIIAKEKSVYLPRDGLKKAISAIKPIPV